MSIKEWFNAAWNASPKQVWKDEAKEKPEFGRPVLAYCKIRGRFVGVYYEIEVEHDFDRGSGHWASPRGYGIDAPVCWAELPELPAEYQNKIGEFDLGFG